MISRDALWERMAVLFANVRASGTELPQALRLTFEEAQRLRRKPAGPSSKRHEPIPGLAELVADAASAHGTTPDAVMGPSKRSGPSRARAEVWLALREQRVPFESIAAAFGRANHSTVVKVTQRYAEHGGAEVAARVSWLVSRARKAA